MTTETTLEELEHAIRLLPPGQRREVLLFIQFLEYREEGEDVDLWQAVEQHQKYRAAHPEEAPEVYASAEEFLRATDNT